MMNIQICEVGPRDGLQSLGVKLSVVERVNFIRQLEQAGIKKLEVGALVHPKYVPEMAGSAEVFESLKNETSGKLHNYALLIPNQKGLEKAFELGCQYFAFFTATSESFNQKNLKMSVQQSVDLIHEMILKTKQYSQTSIIRVYVSTVFHCPYDGVQQIENSLEPFFKLFDQADEISLGDTTGMGELNQIQQLHDLYGETYGEKFWWHFHDTHLKASANTKKVLQLGYNKFDSSAGGIGGCPFAPGAKGNISTEKLIEIIKQAKLEVSIDGDKVSLAAKPVLAKL